MDWSLLERWASVTLAVVVFAYVGYLVFRWLFRSDDREDARRRNRGGRY